MCACRLVGWFPSRVGSLSVCHRSLAQECFRVPSTLPQFSAFGMRLRLEEDDKGDCVGIEGGCECLFARAIIESRTYLSTLSTSVGKKVLEYLGE